MEADWSEIGRIHLPSGDSVQAAPTQPTTLAFDPTHELLWIGNDEGWISSYYGAELQQYTSYRAHAVQGGVRQLVLCEKGVLSVGATSIHLAERKGRTLWHISDESCVDLYSLCLTSKNSLEALVTGCQDQMLRVDIDRGEITEMVPMSDHYTLLKRGGQYFCAATSSGSVQVLNSKTFAVLKSWKAHMGWINDMDANASFLVTCGWSPRQQYGNMLDPLAKVFDLKTLMPLPPVAFHVGAAYVRMHPRMVTTAVIIGRNGQMQIVDIMNSNMVNIRQVNVFDCYLTGLEFAPSGEALAMADSLCCLQLWGSPSRIHFSDYSTPVETVNDNDGDRQHEKVIVDWEGNRPLNSIGMPYYREVLLSAWPGEMLFDMGAPPMALDTNPSAGSHRTELGICTPNTQRIPRNQIENTRSNTALGLSVSIAGPKFLSEQAKEGDSSDTDPPTRRISLIMDAMSSTKLGESNSFDVPFMYRKVEIKYSKFGVEDFDFEYYNKTRFSGLETHIANSYANALLQLLKYIPWIRNLTLLHTASSCLYEQCLLCEMGFLFDMLEKAAGQNCQATNFLKIFSSISHTTSLGLLEENNANRALSWMIQATHRYLLDKVCADYRQTSPSAPKMDQVLATVSLNTIRCAHCSNETVRHGGSYLYELIYPQRKAGNSRSPTFSQVLKASVERQDLTRGWCDRCKRYQHLSTRKVVQAVPPVLAINTAIRDEARQYWAREGWLPSEIGIIIDQGQFFCFEGQDLEMHLQRGAFKIVVFELIGVVAEVFGGEHPNASSHLVSLINVGPSLDSDDPLVEDGWHLFNDFLVRKVPPDDALHFDPSWKLPCVLMYQAKTARHSIDDSWKSSLDTSVLYNQSSHADENEPTPLAYPDEHPQPGTLVGIDAEFVALQKEELEIKPDGSRSIVRPSRLGLARVSVLRGTESKTSEDESFVPFIDDYIHVAEPVADYLTQFSGIRPGDLTPSTSPYTKSGRLVSLKAAYKKLWLLLNLGCVFVGHGLPKDFRTINIQVPKEQVIDTVELFFDRRRGGGRKLSLRFLSWLLLGIRVQEDENPTTGQDNERGSLAGHDSVVDARMALRLWGVWRDAERQGGAKRVDRLISEVYQRGREVGFKVPPLVSTGSHHMRWSHLTDTGTGSESGRVTPALGDEYAPSEGRSAPGTPPVTYASAAGKVLLHGHTHSRSG